MSVLGIFLLNFFRDPERDCVQNDDLILSPADGVVQSVEKIGPEILGEAGWMFTIFLNVFDVHVQRAPVTGTVKDVKRISGRYHPAYKEGIGTINHRVEMMVESPRGKARVSQIAGLLARRIICRLGVGDKAVQGERYGMIVLGSCVQLAVGDKFSPRVEIGTKVKGGLTVLAGLTGSNS